MNKSERRVSAKTALFSGKRIQLIAVLTLAVSVAVYIAIDWANLVPGQLAGKRSGHDCNYNYYSAAAAGPACTSVAASANKQQLSDSSESNASTLYPTRSLKGRHANKPRAWDHNQSNSQGPRPGYTLAELCVTGLDDKAFYCQTGNYDGAFNTAETRAAPGPESGYTISGHVLSSEGLGLNGVRIIASPERLKDQRIPDSGTLRFWTVTDSLGAYSLDGLPDGEYTVRSGGQGPYRSARISARAGVTYADLILYPDAATIAEGQVLSTAGEPLEGVTVLPNVLGQPSVLTDGDGRFRLTVTLKPTVNSFTLRFQRPGYQEQYGKVQREHAGAPSGAAVKVVMHPVESWTELKGTVYSDSGDTLAGRAVELRPQSAHRTYSATTDRHGKYTFPIVESPADYRLIVFGGAEHKDYQQPVHMTVDTAELDVVVESYEFGKVAGQLVNPNGEPVPDFDLVLRNTGSRKPNIVVRTDTYGNFEISAAPAGELVLASQSTPSILVQGLHLSPGGTLHLPLVLDWGQHEIRGLVVDARGNPVPASRIVLVWSHQVDGITTRATRRTAADAQGHFAFNNLGPGPHSLQIHAPGFFPVDIDHDLSRQGYDVTVRLN